MSTAGKPRIVIASSGLGHICRGIESWAEYLGAALADRGQEVLLCQGGSQRRRDFERTIPCWRRGSVANQRLRRCLPTALAWRVGMGSDYGVEQTTFAWNLLPLLRRERIDILHTQDPWVAWIVQRAQQLGWVPSRSILAHGTEESMQFQGQISYLQHGAPWHLEQAQEAGVARSTWAVIPNFVDTARFSPGTSPALRRELEIPDDACVVLTVAAVKRKHKRIDWLLSEFRRLPEFAGEQRIFFVIAGGRATDTEAIIAEGRELLGERVRFLIDFPRERMAELYRVADLFTLGSLKEMMPLAVLEALASGLPCILHQHPVMHWMIGAGGCSVNMEREGLLAKEIARLCDDHPWRGELSRAARQRAEAEFACDRVVDEILEYYARVLAGSRCSDLIAC